MSAADVFAPAIALAERGFPLTKRGEKFFAANFGPGDRLSVRHNQRPLIDPELTLN